MQDAGPRAGRLRLLVILGALSAFGPLSIDMYLPSLPSLARDLGAREPQVQLTLTACLAGLALGQALAGPVSATGIVIARAVVRDRHEGVAAARYFSALMLVFGLAPILAPLIGSQVLRITSWRGIFVVLGVYGAVLLCAAAAGLGESLPPQRRRSGGLRDAGSAFTRLSADRTFLGYALACGLALAAMFACPMPPRWPCPGIPKQPAAPRPCSASSSSCAAPPSRRWSASGAPAPPCPWRC
jgi:DHA1 family bicyclomycin/chloramphenicol resistance-like MFS transporter